MTGPYTGSLLPKLLASADGAKAKWVLREALSRLPADQCTRGVRPYLKTWANSWSRKST